MYNLVFVVSTLRMGLITMTNVPSFMNQAVLIRKLAVEMGYEVEFMNTSEAIQRPKQRYDKCIALVPLWARYIYDASRILAVWFTRSGILYGPVDGPFKTNLALFGVAKQMRIVVPSEFCRRCLLKNELPVLDVVPHGINHSDFEGFDNAKYGRLKRLREEYPDKKILFSNLNPLHRKGFNHLVKALHILHQKIPDKYIFILHTGKATALKYEPKLEKTPNLIIEDQFGKLPFRAIAEKTVACDIYVHPSLNEGFGEPILEAAATKRTIVCLDAPAMNEIVSAKEAWLFPMSHIREEVWQNGAVAQLHEYNPVDLAEAMQHAIEDENESLEKAEKAYKKSLDYDYRKVYSKLIAY